MKTKKLLLVLGASALTSGLFAGISLGKANAVSAADPWSESFNLAGKSTAYGDSLVGGKSVVEGTHFDYAVKYRSGGPTATLTAFTSAQYNAEDQHKLKVNDNLYFNDWSLFAGAGGIIFEFAAKENMTVSGIGTDGRFGWYTDMYQKIYSVKNGTYSLITEVKCTGNGNANTEWAFDKVSIKSGEGLAIEYYFQWSGSRNLQIGTDAILPTYTFNQAGKVYKEEWTETTDYKKDVIAFAKAKVDDSSVTSITSESGHYEVSFLHGCVADDTLAQFDKVSGNGSTSANLAVDNAGAADANKANFVNWVMYSGLSKDACVIKFVAKESMTFKGLGVAFGGSPYDAYIKYHLKRVGDAKPALVSSTQLTQGNYDKESGSELIRLDAGDIVYWEFFFEWTDWRRNIQTNFPAFELNGVDDNKVLDTFVAEKMHMDVTGKGTGQCVSEGWYTAAKAEYTKFTPGQIKLFATSAEYAEPFARLVNWAEANGEVIGADGIFLEAAASNIVVGDSAVQIALIASIFVLSAAGFFFFIRRRKAIR